MATPPPLSSRAQTLVQSLGLAPHPEGGFYREVFRSPANFPSRCGYADAADGSDSKLQRPGRRAALTVIHFLLPHGACSAWHRVATADEAWHFIEGDPLELLWLEEPGRGHHAASLGASGNGSGCSAGSPAAAAVGPPSPPLASHGTAQLMRVRLGALDDGGMPVAVVPAGAWQAARLLGGVGGSSGCRGYALVSCDVAPGFEFADFSLLRDAEPSARDAVLASHPEAAAWL
jgi:uncharacterized protein